MECVVAVIVAGIVVVLKKACCLLPGVRWMLPEIFYGGWCGFVRSHSLVFVFVWHR